MPHCTLFHASLGDIFVTVAGVILSFAQLENVGISVFFGADFISQLGRGGTCTTSERSDSIHYLGSITIVLVS